MAQLLFLYHFNNLNHFFTCYHCVVLPQQNSLCCDFNRILKCIKNIFFKFKKY